MNTRYYKRVNNFSILKAQESALTKAKTLGLDIKPNTFDTNLYPDNPVPDFRKINRFGDRYIDIFGDHAQDYIYGLAHPFDKENWYSATYLPISETILIDYFYVVGYGFEQTIGDVMLTVQQQHEHSFSDIKILPDGAELYVGGELFVVVEKIAFNDEPDATTKEITSALKGVNVLYDKSPITTQATHGRLAKVKGFEHFEGYALHQYDGHYVHSSLSNFAKGFQFILSEFTDKKVPLNVAEKVMWAFFGIDNEHILRANEKAGCITGTLYITSSYDSNSGRFQEIQNHISLPSALSGFQRERKRHGVSNEPFHIDAKSIGSCVHLPVDDHISAGIEVRRIESQKYVQACMGEAKKLFAGKVTFSSRQDLFIETFVVKDVELKLYEIDGELHTVDHLNNLIPVNALLFHSTKDTVWRVEADYSNNPNKYKRPDPSTLPTKWHISRQKYGKPTTALFRLGALSLEDIEHIVSKLKIKAKSSLSHNDMETCMALSKINRKYNTGE